ncbi:MAG: DUF2188 domain-containing protein [Ignavibacteria bacterium]|nr:DUF2188 domain-containing protein [Ignavibacteria bacterium]
MLKGNQHVIPLGNAWAVKREGSKRFTIITEYKRSALKIAREFAQQNRSELVIHDRDGKIQDKESYVKNLNLSNSGKPLKEKSRLKSYSKK